MALCSTSSLFIDKYAPLHLSEFDNDPVLMETLGSLMEQGYMNVLLVGGVSCGKTSIGNALVRAYLQGNESNVLRLHCLQEQGIQYFRNEVKTFCQTKTCVSGKKKVVFIDDLDTVNEQGQHVFRACLDKYGSNVWFVATCTNVQKVIESLQSRLTKFLVRPIHDDTMERLFDRVVREEGLQVDPLARDFMLRVADRSVPLLLHNLEKIHLLRAPRVSLALAEELCTHISFASLRVYTERMLQRDVDGALSVVYELIDRGHSVMDILDMYVLFVKTTQLLTELQAYAVLPLLCKYIAIFHNVHEDELEMVLFTVDMCAMLASS